MHVFFDPVQQDSAQFLAIHSSSFRRRNTIFGGAIGQVQKQEVAAVVASHGRVDLDTIDLAQDLGRDDLFQVG